MVGQIAQVDYVSTTANGNPWYRVRLTDGRSALTGKDAAVNYGITNPEYRNCTVSLQLSRGCIIGIETV